MKLKIVAEERIIGALIGAGVGAAVTAPLVLLAGPLPGLLPHDLAGEPLWAAGLHALMLGTAVACTAAGVWIASRQESEQHISGTLYLPELRRAVGALQAIQNADMSDEQRASKVHGLVLGGVELSRSAETRHLLVIGLQGGGKTVLLDAALDQIEQRRERRMIFDPKKDFVKGRYDPARAVLLGPWDSRSVVWDAAADFDTPSRAYEFCQVLYQVAARPEHKRWVGGAARIVAGLIIAEMLDARREKRAAAWTWATVADQIRSMSDVAMIVRAATGDSTIRTLIPSAFSTGKLTRDEVSITNTIPEGIDVIKMLAATDAAKPGALRFSLRRWLTREAHADIQTVIFNFDENYKTAAAVIFGAMLDVVSSTINSSLPEQGADAPGGMWFVVDEAHQLGAEGLTKLISLDAVARSRGMRMVIATQDESQFVSALGRDKAASLLALAGTRIYAQTSPDVARAICDRAGEKKVLQISNTATGGAVQGKTAPEHVLPALLASDLTGLVVRRKRWWKPWAETGAEVIVQSGATLGKLIQPFGARRADIAEAFIPCPAWQWGEHHAADATRSNAQPQPTPPIADDGRAPPQPDAAIDSPFDDPSPGPDVESPFTDTPEADTPDTDAIDWTKEF